MTLHYSDPRKLTQDLCLVTVDCKYLKQGLEWTGRLLMFAKGELCVHIGTRGIWWRREQTLKDQKLTFLELEFMAQ